MKKNLMVNGNMVTIFDSQYKDWEGNEIERTPNKYPYSYDAYVIHKTKESYEHSVYSDRLFQWDTEKYNKLSKKHFGNIGQYFSERSPRQIEEFLKDYYNKPDLELVGIMQGCNIGNGYPYWVFMFNAKF